MILDDLELLRKEFKRAKFSNNKSNDLPGRVKINVKCDKCDKEYQISYSHLKKINFVHELCISCTNKLRTGRKQTDEEKKNNPTYLIYWLNKGFSEEEAHEQLKKLSPFCKEYWLNKGFSEEEACEKRNLAGKKCSFSKEAIKKKYNFSDEEVDEFLSSRNYILKGEEKKKYSRWCKEYWLNKGFSEEESVKLGKEHSKESRKFRDNEALSRRVKIWNSNLTEEEKAEIRRKSSVSMKKYNRTHSPIFKEYWLSRGFSEEESIIKQKETKFVNGENKSSKIQLKCIKELQEYLGIVFIEEKFITCDKKRLCPDVRFDNFIIEFYGTRPHLDERLCYNRKTTPWGVDKEIKRNEDKERVISLLKRYNVIVIWEFDYKKRKDYIFERIKEFINDQKDKEDRRYWDSANI